MKQNCAFACGSHAKGGAIGGRYTYDPIACARWAMSGMCEDGNAHVAFMKQNCPSECEAALSVDPNAGTPPPADIWLILIIGGFGALAFHAIKRSVASDAEKNSTVKSKTLGITEGVGPGKMNRSAMNMQVRRQRARSCHERRAGASAQAARKAEGACCNAQLILVPLLTIFTY